MLRPAWILGADPHLAQDQRAEGGVNVGPLLTLPCPCSHRSLQSDLESGSPHRWKQGSAWRQSPAADVMPEPQTTLGPYLLWFPVPRAKAGSEPSGIRSLSQTHSLWDIQALQGWSQGQGWLHYLWGSVQNVNRGTDFIFFLFFFSVLIYF